MNPNRFRLHPQNTHPAIFAAIHPAMDSTPSTRIQPQPISSIKPSSTTKLPIKRKDSSSSNPDSPILITPKFEPITPDYLLNDEDDENGYTNNIPAGGIADIRPPPFKFHRIWTEPDEIRFLQGLLECSNQSFSFPRDLGIFYSRFSNTMSQPYTKSQLSEKIRRLRKKFRVILARLEKGLDKALLSPHDRALYELSKQLWHPDYACSSPFFNSGSGSCGSKPVKSTLVGVKVSFSPVLPSVSTAILALPSATNQETVQNTSATKIIDDQNKNHDGVDEFGNELDGDVKLSEVNVELDDGVGEEVPLKSDLWGEVENLAKKALVDAFDQTVEDVRMALDHHCGSTLDDCLKGEREKCFEKRWREQRVVEFEVLAKRLRLIVEHSVEKQ